MNGLGAEVRETPSGTYHRVAGANRTPASRSAEIANYSWKSRGGAATDAALARQPQPAAPQTTNSSDRRHSDHPQKSPRTLKKHDVTDSCRRKEEPQYVASDSKLNSVASIIASTNQKKATPAILPQFIYSR